MLLVGLAVLYAVQLLAFARGLRRVLAQPLPPLPDPPPTVSVIVPARNEAARIDACLAALTASTYPAFDVTVVDDFSDDATDERVAAWAERDGRVRLLRLVDTGLASAFGHKGAALAAGIRASAGQYVLSTDADCAAHPGWIEAMVRMFNAPEVGFVAGWAKMRPGRTLLGRMQALEFAGLVGAGAGALGAGDPNMCNSASLAYPRAVFEAFSPDQETDRSPWDDERLLHAIAASPSYTARFCSSPEAVVVTDPEPSFAAYFRQRRRWAALGAAYNTPGAAYTARLTWAFNAALLAGVALLATPHAWMAWLAALALKAGSEALVLVPTARHLGLGRLVVQFVPQQLVQIPLTVALGIATLWGQPVWKGRSFNEP